MNGDTTDDTNDKTMPDPREPQILVFSLAGITEWRGTTTGQKGEAVNKQNGEQKEVNKLNDKADEIATSIENEIRKIL